MNVLFHFETFAQAFIMVWDIVFKKVVLSFDWRMKGSPLLRTVIGFLYRDGVLDLRVQFSVPLGCLLCGR